MSVCGVPGFQANARILRLVGQGMYSSNLATSLRGGKGNVMSRDGTQIITRLVMTLQWNVRERDANVKVDVNAM